MTRRWKPSHRQTIALVVTGVLVLAGVGAYASYRGYTTSVEHTGSKDLERAFNDISHTAQNDANTKDKVLIVATIDGVSPDSHTVPVRLRFYYYRNGREPFLSKPAKVTIIGGVADPGSAADTNLSELSLGVDQPQPTVDVTMNVTDDSAPKYPFDSYQGQLSLRVTGSDGKPLEAAMIAANEANGWMVSKTMQNKAAGVPAAFGYSFDIHRTTDAKFYAIFIVALMWLLALAGVVMAVILIGRKGEEVGPDHLVYLAALLFAFPLMRTLLPGNPPLGILADFAGYFWAEVIVGITLLALLVTWIVRTRRTHEEIDLRGASVEREESTSDLVDVH